MATTSAASSSAGTLDVPSLVSQLMANERKPIDKLNTKVASYQTKISSFGTLKGLASGFQTALQSLNTSVAGYSATPSDTSVFSASSASTAAAGTYSISVTTLAQAQKLATGGLASDTSIISAGASTATFTVGGAPNVVNIGVNATLQDIRAAINAANIGVTATIVNDGSATPYHLALSSDSTGLSNAINSIAVAGGSADITGLLTYPATNPATAGSNTVAPGTKVAAAPAGTTAGTLAAGTLIANTSTGAISIGAVTLGTNAKTNGDAIALAINTALAAATGGATVNGTAVADGAGVITITAGSSAITLSMGGVAANSTTATANQAALVAMTGFSAAQLGTQAFGPQQTIAAQDASFTVNGIPITKSSNTVTDAVQGVTLTLSKASTATLMVARDTTAINTAASGFVDAYNALASQLKSRSAYGNASTPAGGLAGDGTVRLMLDQLRSIFNTPATPASGGTLTSLSQVGITSQADGTLKLNSTTLNSAMATNFSDVTNLFSSATGFATRLDTWSTSVVQAGGLIDTRTTSLNTYITGYNDRISKLEIRMTALQKQYTTTYSNLNMMLSNMNNTSTYLTQQFARSQGA